MIESFWSVCRSSFLIVSDGRHESSSPTRSSSISRSFTIDGGGTHHLAWSPPWSTNYGTQSGQPVITWVTPANH